MHEPPDGTKRNLNTILLAVVIAVLLGNGGMTMQNTVKLAEISASAIQRPEIEGRLQQVRLDIAGLEAEIQKIKIEVVGLQMKAKL